MTNNQGSPRRLELAWLSAWPLCALLVFASLAAVRLLPVGYARTVVAAPILLIVPGSLTLGAVFRQCDRPRGMIFTCYAVLLSVVWSIMASLILYSFAILITAASTYWCLLIFSTLLAIVAEVRLLLEREGRGRRVARKPEPMDPDLSYAEANDRETSRDAKPGGYLAIIAVMAGTILLGGGVFVYNHLSHPAPNEYTTIAWTRPRIEGDIAVSRDGGKLGFLIVHHESNTATFRLSADWFGSPSRPLAKSVALTIGPNQTFRGTLLVPPLLDGCTYRIMVSLTATRQIDPLTKKLQTFSINANVHDPSKSLKTCK